MVYDLMNVFNTGTFKSKCLPPCTSVEYTVAERNTEVVKNGMEDIYIEIDQNVQVVRTFFVVDLLTLLNRLGGTIGICKEVLWCILILVGVVESALHVCRTMFYPATMAQEEKGM